MSKPKQSAVSRAVSSAIAAVKKPGNARKCPTLPGAARAIVENEANLGARLSERQLAALNRLFAGETGSEICRALCIDPKTLYRWRRSDAFVAEVTRRYEAGARLQTRHFEQAVSPKRAPRAPLPPRREDEPLWMREIRKSTAETMATVQRHARESQI